MSINNVGSFETLRTSAASSYITRRSVVLTLAALLTTKLAFDRSPGESRAVHHGVKKQASTALPRDKCRRGSGCDRTE